MFFNKRIMKQSTAKFSGNPILNSKCLFLGKGKIQFGKNVNIGYFPSPLFYSTYGHIEARNSTSEIFIDENTYINNNCSIVSNTCKISIGKNCRIGINFQCYDSDFHGIKVDDRDNFEAIKNKDVSIEDNVFIGNNVIVLKGVTIGCGSIVGAGSVVTKDVPPLTVVAGNPAKFIKKIGD